jgi:S-adenosylmethionine synthetase
MSEFLFSSESVTEGHPDKIADQISDAVLDAVLADDPKGRVACETFVTTGLALVGGEITTSTYVDIPKLVRETIKGIGYTNAHYGFDYETCAVVTSIDQQSRDIGQGVDTGGAGDQGMMFGYASNETPELMPLPIMLAHRLTRRLAYVRKEEICPFLRPDGKSQVTVLYRDNKPVKITTVVLAAQHDPDIEREIMRQQLIENVIFPMLPPDMVDKKTLDIFINPTGRFVQGGPHADSGLTGRKIIADTYGGFAPHGGGCFSGKDPTKVDRSATYAARWVAKNLVAAGLAERCTIQLAYVIGVAKPVSVMVNSHGTGKDEKLQKLINEKFDLTPQGIIERLNLRRPVYKKTAAYGHFGREEDGFTWEITDMADKLG